MCRIASLYGRIIFGYNHYMQNNIDILRKKAGLTLDQLAELMGITRSYLMKLKAGRQRLNADHLEKMAEIFKCDPSEIIGEGTSNDNVSRLNVSIFTHIMKIFRQGKHDHNLYDMPIETEAAIVAQLYEEAIDKQREGLLKIHSLEPLLEQLLSYEKKKGESLEAFIRNYNPNTEEKNDL